MKTRLLLVISLVTLFFFSNTAQAKAVNCCDAGWKAKNGNKKCEQLLCDQFSDSICGATFVPYVATVGDAFDQVFGSGRCDSWFRGACEDYDQLYADLTGTETTFDNTSFCGYMTDGLSDEGVFGVSLRSTTEFACNQLAGDTWHNEKNWNCGENDICSNNQCFGETAFSLCQQIKDPAANSKCQQCAQVDANGKSGVWTAVGCIKTDPISMVRTLLDIGLSVAGGAVLLTILAGGFLYSTSQGNPQNVTKAKELITSAIYGLLFILFSITILQFIGVEILHIPNFG